MANTLTYNDKTFSVGDVIAVDYKIKERNSDKERIQEFKGQLTKIKGGADHTRMFTVRKMSKVGIGVERIFPVASPHIADIALIKESTYTKAKLNFLPQLSEQEIRLRLFKTRKSTPAHAKKHAKKSSAK